MQRRSGNMLSSMISGMILPGLLAGLAVCIIGALITTALIHAEQIKETSAGYGVVISLILAAFASAMVMIAKSKGNKLVAAAVSAAGVIAMLVLGNFLMGAGPINGFPETMLVILAGTVCAILLNRNPTSKRKYRNRKY